MSDSAEADGLKSPSPRVGRLPHGWGQLSWGRILLLCAVGAVLVGAYVYLFVPRRYAAVTSILLNEQPDVATSLSLLAGSSGGTSGGNVLGVLGLGGGGNQARRLEEALRSRRLREQLLEKYGLRERLGLRSEDKALRWMAKVTKVQDMGGGVPGVGGSVGLRITVTLPSSGRVREWLGKPSPLSTRQAQELCAQLANDYVALLDQYITESSVGTAREDRIFIEKRKQEVQARLTRTEDQLQALQAKYQVVDPDLEAQRLLAMSKEAQQNYAAAGAEMEAAKRSLETARRALTRQQALRISQEVTVRNPVLEALADKLAQMRLEWATEVASGKSAQHPDMVALRAAIASAESQEAAVAREVRASLTSAANPTYDDTMGKVVDLEVDLAAARARRAKYEALVSRLEAEVNNLPPVARRYAHLVRQRDMEADLVAVLAKRLEMAMMQEQMQSAKRFQVLDVAVPPVDKVGPSAVYSAAGAFLLLVSLFGIAWAYNRGLLALEQ